MGAGYPQPDVRPHASKMAPSVDCGMPAGGCRHGRRLPVAGARSAGKPGRKGGRGDSRSAVQASGRSPADLARGSARVLRARARESAKDRGLLGRHENARGVSGCRTSRLPKRSIVELSGLAAGAYDTYTAMLLSVRGTGRERQRLLFAHELYHGLQDQHFDLKRYLLERWLEPGANSDEVLARQAVVEGEASYVDTIYRGAWLTIAADARAARGPHGREGRVERRQWEESLQNPALTEDVAQLLRAIEARKRLPRFMFETFIGNIHRWHGIHPRRAGERLVRSREAVRRISAAIDRADTASAKNGSRARRRSRSPGRHSTPTRCLPTGKCSIENVMGERLWRVVFREQGLASEAHSAAAGWNGDRYAVFRNRRDSTLSHVDVHDLGHARGRRGICAPPIAGCSRRKREGAAGRACSRRAAKC